ncbi:MAG: ABC transporter substrate-binding protein [Selenomonadaceae bacterium]|nr:ABC transporter substrate-binding protein [Selenomonadaceae bacterium]
MKRGLWVILGLLMLTLAAGCGQTKETGSASKAFAVLEDDAGRKVELAAKPERIVVTSASFLEPLHAVGGDVVGRPDSKTKMPEYAKDKASVGQVFQIDVEKVLSCEPDLVIVNKGMNEKLVPVLEESGIKTLVVDMKSYKDVKHELVLFAGVVGNPKLGEEIIADMDKKIQETRQKIPSVSRRVCVLHSTNQGLSVQLDGSIAGSIVKMLGWENVAAGLTPMEKNPDAAPYSMETLVELNPEIIFVTSMGKPEEIKAGMEEMFAESSAWQTVAAIRDKRVYYLPQDMFLLSPGIHYPEAVTYMAGQIYPEVQDGK